MTTLVVENIIASAVIADKLDINYIAEKIPDFKYNPDEFSGLSIKLDHPKTAIIILPSGKIICTGGKNIEDVEESIRKIAERIKGSGVKLKTKTNMEIHNMIVTTNLNKDLHLSSLSKALIGQKDYEPDKFPGLIYKIEDMQVVILLFSSGKLVCSGAKNFDDSKKAIEIMKEKLTSVGAL